MYIHAFTHTHAETETHCISVSKLFTFSSKVNDTRSRNWRHKFDARFWSVCHTVWRASGVKFLPVPVSGVK